MASEKILQQKQAYVEQLAEKLNSSVAGVVVSYKGISVADDTMLRRKMREAGVEYSVVKNTMLRRAAEKVGLNELDSVLEGSTALAVSDKAEVEELAKMPPKEVLVAKVLGGLNAPITGFVGVLHANLRGLVCALNAIAEKQSA